jgi:hypothetical protein
MKPTETFDLWRGIRLLPDALSAREPDRLKTRSRKVRALSAGPSRAVKQFVESG